MSSPFKFLDAYTREDKDQFFGREEETAQLYELVNQNRLVLLYGPSGTGKTSLIQCGLGNRFDATDWMPIFIRRGTHLPTSLQNALLEHAEEELEGNFWEMEENPLIEIIQDLFAEYLRPIYLVFDQLEEIFVLGDEEEERIFTQAMADIYNAKLPCRLIFILREEYLAHLYDFEQRIPSLFKRRLRVEAMNIQQAREVVRKSCERFNIRLSDPAYNPGQIVHKVTDGRAGVALPYLQVYLDRLYREDFARSYPDKDLGNFENFLNLPSLEFTTEEIDEFGEIGDVLKAFLQEQTQTIEKDLRNLEDFANLPPRAVRKVLNVFASLQGTKIPRLRRELQVPPLTNAQLDVILERLRQARILREEEGTYELAHDTLAGEIANQRSGSEQALLEIVEMVRNRHNSFERTQTHLDTKELQLIDQYKVQLKEEHKLNEKEWNFVRDSQQEADRKRKRRNRVTVGIIGVLSVLLVLAGWQWNKAVRAQKYADAASIAAQANEKKAQKALLDVYKARLDLIANDLKAADTQLGSAKKSELPSSIINARTIRRDSIIITEKKLQAQLDSLSNILKP